MDSYFKRKLMNSTFVSFFICLVVILIVSCSSSTEKASNFTPLSNGQGEAVNDPKNIKDEFNSENERVAVENLIKSLLRRTKDNSIPKSLVQQLVQEKKEFLKLLKFCDAYNSYHVGFDKFYKLSKGRHLVILQCTETRSPSFVYSVYNPLEENKLSLIKLIFTDSNGNFLRRDYGVGVYKYDSNLEELTIFTGCMSREACGGFTKFKLEDDSFIMKTSTIGRVRGDGKVIYKQIYPQK